MLIYKLSDLDKSPLETCNKKIPRLCLKRRKICLTRYHSYSYNKCMHSSQIRIWLLRNITGIKPYNIYVISYILPYITVGLRPHLLLWLQLHKYVNEYCKIKPLTRSAWLLRGEFRSLPLSSHTCRWLSENFQNPTIPHHCMYYNIYFVIMNRLTYWMESVK